MMKTPDLKPCPMCDSVAFMTVERLLADSFLPNKFIAKWEVACRHCGVKVEGDVSYMLENGEVVEIEPGIKRLIYKWNRRVKDENA